MKQLNWYQIFGKSNIPDGRTVLPTDDIQIWLHCANIWNKPYTTLAEVLADTNTLLALITSNNAVDYMVRSTTWAVSQTLVPVMTDNTHPYGECFASSYRNAGGEYYPPYMAFDGDNSTFWQSSTSEESPTYSHCGYHLVNASFISEAYIKSRETTNSAFKLRASNDGINWTELTEEVTLNSGNNYSYTFNLTPSVAYEYYDFYGKSLTSGWACRIHTAQFYSAPITADATAMTYIGQNNYCANTLLADATWRNAICNSEYFESVLNVKVPAMTSNTTPEGEVVYDSTHSNYPPYQAFDGNDNTMCATATDSPTLHYFGYAFVEPVKIYFVEWIPRYDHKTRTKVRASADGSTWIDMTDFIADNLTTKQKYSTVLENPSIYRYWCCQGNVTDGNGYGMNYFTIQFYGREDV